MCFLCVDAPASAGRTFPWFAAFSHVFSVVAVVAVDPVFVGHEVWNFGILVSDAVFDSNFFEKLEVVSLESFAVVGSGSSFGLGEFVFDEFFEFVVDFGADVEFGCFFDAGFHDCLRHCDRVFDGWVFVCIDLGREVGGGRMIRGFAVAMFWVSSISII